MRSLPLLAAVASCALLTACAAGGGLTPQAGNIANTIIADGQLFCAFASGPGAGAVVDAACRIINGIMAFPVLPPANQAAVPVIAPTAPAG